ncbi:MAG: (2Fe-2S) ferredoxin domain-containing protein [Thermoanaerobaculaceae bacterium]|nr:(2Fe-2S) ferredoxin domain-containing protein [Thermoanaerobaculaceae bacterium]
MEPFRYHVYICTQEKPEGQPCCGANGSAKVLDALRAEVGKAGLGDEVQITTSGSLGLCERGPNMVVYPEGVWYSRVRVEDVGEIVREHFGGGHPVARLLSGDAAALKGEALENKRRYLAFMAAQKAAAAKG